MGLILDAACGCNTGKVRKNNEDNFFFNKSCLDLENCGLQDTVAFSSSLNKKHFFAVFDGMGGENFGEVASFTAAATMKNEKRTFSELFISDEKYLQKLTDKLNNAIVEKKKELLTNRCGSTMVALYFSKKKVYTINVGDSRAYRLREGKLSQLSVDHVVKLPEGTRKKAPLTQHLGIDPEDMEIEPYIKGDATKNGDVYLLCSDGITDMLTDLEISDIMQNCENAKDCTDKLILSALEHGGRDNITAIVCRIK